MLLVSLVVHTKAEIVETTLVVSRFHFLRVGSRISELRVIILPGTQILKVGSQISNCSRFCFSFLKFFIGLEKQFKVPKDLNYPHVQGNNTIIGKWVGSGVWHV